MRRRRFVFGSMYTVIKLDKRTTCPHGHSGLVQLIPRCESKMPAFYLCHRCGFIGEIGVGVVTPGKEDA